MKYKSLRKFLVFVLLPGVLCFCAGAEAQTTRPAGGEAASAPGSALEIVAQTVTSSGVVVVRLDNGLTVIVAENHNAPVVCVRAYVRAGGMYEGKYLGAGISHLCEHLVAEDAEHHHGPGQAVARKTTGSKLDKIGGQSNAYTSLAHTCYYIAATSGKTDECIDLVADWMARPEFTEADFRREHGVVQRELEMGRDDPGRRMWYAHAQNFYQTHPAAVPVIGYQTPLAALTFEDVKDYHRRMYVPGNMVFVVAGDVETASVLDRVRRAFADFPIGKVPDLSLPEVPPVSATRRVSVSHQAITQTMEDISFRTIPLIHEDLYALDVLSYVLTMGDSARLVRVVRRDKRLVTSISSASWTPAWGAGQFTISFRCEPPKADRAEEAIVGELRKIVAEGVSAEELARAKRQKVADFVYSQQTVQSQAATLASDYLAAADVEFSRRYTDRIKKVTAAEVQEVARRYFQLDRMVVTRLVPADFASGIAGKAAAAGKAETRFFKLPNGLRVILHSTPAVDLVSMTLVTRGGVLAETPKTNGIGMLMAALSTKGAGELSAEEVAAFFDGAGGSISGQCGNNTFYWQATVLSDSFSRALDVFADVILRPTYAEKELEILRPILLARIRQTEEHWHGLLSKRWRADFFRDSPLSMLPLGSAEVVRSADRKSIAEYHFRHIRAGASVLAIYGNFDVDQTARSVRELFGAMPEGEPKTPELPARAVAEDGEDHVHASKLETAGVVVAAPGMTLGNVHDRLAITVLDTIISGYRLPRGWLHEELRGKKLVYVVHAYNWPALVPGAFVVYANCEPAKAQEVAAVIRRNLKRTLSHPFSQAEVDKAVNFVLTAELLENQEMEALSLQAALDELYGMGYDFRSKYEGLLRAVTPDQVARVAKEYLGGGLVTTIVTPKPGLVSAKKD